MSPIRDTPGRAAPSDMINQYVSLPFLYTVDMRFCYPKISFVSKFNYVLIGNRVSDHASIQRIPIVRDLEYIIIVHSYFIENMLNSRLISRILDKEGNHRVLDEIKLSGNVL
jgi:hypothetical protein